MFVDLGDFIRDETIYVPFQTFNTTNGASITLTGLATTDIEIYKNGSVTQRSSDNGYSLLDTDGIDFDGVTGIHGFSIDLSDDTDSGFYAAGNDYWLVVSSVTVNSQTVNFGYKFSIENRADTKGKILFRGTCSAATATTLTLPSGASTTNGTYDGAFVVPISGTGAGQTGRYASTSTTYNGSTLVLTLAQAFETTLPTDSNVIIYAGSAETVVVQDEVQTVIETNKLDHLLATAESDDPADNTVLAKLAATSGDWSDFVASTDSMQSITDAIAVMDALVDAIKAKTDSLTFTQANMLDAQVQYVAGEQVTGSGTTADPWRPVP